MGRGAVLVAAGVGAIACAGGDYGDASTADSVTVSPALAHRVMQEAAGDVALDSVAPAAKWLDDGNVLALLAVIDARQIDASNLELGAWHSDTVRSFASTMRAEHAAMQHAADSLAAVLRIAPVPPALADSLSAAMQARVDALRGLGGADMDHAFMAEQIASDQLADSYLKGLTGLAERPEVQALVASAEQQTASELERAQTLQTTSGVADSLKADSLARRAANRRPR